jgi:hypothetical protein
VLASRHVRPPKDPVRPTDDEARALARSLIAGARFGALGVIDPETGAPMVTRIAVVPGPDGVPLTLISTLSSHTAALDANPACSLLLGEPGAKGDPLTHPRLTLQAVAEAGQGRAEGPLPRALSQGAALLRFRGFPADPAEPVAAFLNGGFGKGLSPDRRGPAPRADAYQCSVPAAPLIRPVRFGVTQPP